MASSSRRGGSRSALVLGILIGALIAIGVLASSPPPSSGYRWPPAAQVESVSTTMYHGASAALAQEYLAAGCTTMLADVDSAAAIEVWVTPWHTAIDLNSTTPPASSYYWSGLPGVEHVSQVITDVNPADGVAMAVYDPNYNANVTASFGYVFEANC